MEVFINCKFARNTNLSYENNYLNTQNEAIMLCKKNEIKSEEKKSILHNSGYWIDQNFKVHYIPSSKFWD